MRCEICKECVFGKNGVTVSGIGAAHADCFEMEKNKRRVFEGIDISNLSNESLNNLYDLVMSEKNVRSKDFSSESIELF